MLVRFEVVHRSNFSSIHPLFEPATSIREAEQQATLLMNELLPVRELAGDSLS